MSIRIFRGDNIMTQVFDIVQSTPDDTDRSQLVSVAQRVLDERSTALFHGVAAIGILTGITDQPSIKSSHNPFADVGEITRFGQMVMVTLFPLLANNFSLLSLREMTPTRRTICQKAANR